MPNILNVSSLRKYAEVLEEVEYGKPVFLTKNGKGAYVIIKMEEYDEMKALQILQQQKVDTHVSNELSRRDEGVDEQNTIGTNIGIHQQFVPNMETINKLLKS